MFLEAVVVVANYLVVLNLLAIPHFVLASPPSLSVIRYRPVAVQVGADLVAFGH